MSENDDTLTAPDAAAETPESSDSVIARLESEKADLIDRLLRTHADLDNTRKRADREKADARIYGIEKFAGDVLAVADTLARALAALSEDDRAGLSDSGRSLFDGIAMTEKQLTGALSRHGVTPIEAAPGSAFDANLHQAVTQIPSPHPSGTIAECFQPGWKIGERTLRAAMVAVSAGGTN